MTKRYTFFLIQILSLFGVARLHESNVTHLNNVGFKSSNHSASVLGTDECQQCNIGAVNSTGDTKLKSEDVSSRVRRAFPKNDEAPALKLAGVFWDDVWKSPDINWVAKRVNNEIRPSDRQFFHTLIPDTIFGLKDLCIHLDEKDERDFTVLANISWKDREPSLRYPPVPEQCAFGRSSGFLCVLLDDGDSCHYVSGWGQDRVQALVDGRHSQCGHRQHLHMMLHALGLMHEHDRGDALRFVTLHPRLRMLARPHDPIEYRIPQDDCALFRQNASSLPFDFDSIVLHDDSFQANSPEMDYELPLIPKHPSDMRHLLASHRPELSHFDRFKLRHLYGCEAKNCPPDFSCGNFGFRNELCQCECAPGYTGKQCELIQKPAKDPCLHTVTHEASFALNETNCVPRSQQPFNFTIDLSGKKSNRFVITVDLTPVRDVLEPLRLLPSCEHARLYFTGTGAARPRPLCAERLVLSPVTLRTTYHSAMLILMLHLPDSPREKGQPDPAIAAIGAIHLSITSKPSPEHELQVDTTRPPPPTTTTTISTTSTTEEPTTTFFFVETEPPTEPPPAPSPPTNPPSSSPTTKHANLNVMPTLDLGLAQKSGGSTAARTAGIITAVLITVLVLTVILVIVMLRHRSEDVDELEFEELQRANEAGAQSVALYAVSQQTPQPTPYEEGVN